MTSPSTADPTTLRALSPSERALAPDLARGVMLLLICLANVSVYLVGDSGVRGKPAADSMSAADRVVTVVQLALVDGRAFPLFGLLVGYGAWQLAARRLAHGMDPRAVSRLLRRRGLALMLLGTLHGVLLFAGDIAAAYGLLLIILAGAIVRGRRSLVVVTCIGVVLVALFGLVAAFPLPEGSGLLESVATDSALLALPWRAGEFVLIGLLGNIFGVFGVVALGVLAGRRGLLDDPTRHRRGLTVLAVGGLGAAVLGGLPLGLLAAGYVEVGSAGTALVGSLHSVTGYAGGVGYGALFGLLATRWQDRSALPAVVSAPVALGRRSLSGYLLHSVVFVTLLPIWSLGLGDDLGVAPAAGLAVLTWLLMLGAAVAMEAAGVRGPAEVLLRRLTYGRRHR